VIVTGKPWAVQVRTSHRRITDGSSAPDDSGSQATGSVACMESSEDNWPHGRMSGWKRRDATHPKSGRVASERYL
jgi:hypothetical protein